MAHRYCVEGISPAMCFHQKADAKRYAKLVRKGLRVGDGKPRDVKVVKRATKY